MIYIKFQYKQIVTQDLITQYNIIIKLKGICFHYVKKIL